MRQIHCGPQLPHKQQRVHHISVQSTTTAPTHNNQHQTVTVTKHNTTAHLANDAAICSRVYCDRNANTYRNNNNSKRKTRRVAAVIAHTCRVTDGCNCFSNVATPITSGMPSISYVVLVRINASTWGRQANILSSHTAHNTITATHQSHDHKRNDAFAA